MNHKLSSPSSTVFRKGQSGTRAGPNVGLGTGSSALLSQAVSQLTFVSQGDQQIPRSEGHQSQRGAPTRLHVVQAWHADPPVVQLACNDAAYHLLQSVHQLRLRRQLQVKCRLRNAPCPTRRGGAESLETERDLLVVAAVAATQAQEPLGLNSVLRGRRLTYP